MRQKIKKESEMGVKNIRFMQKRMAKNGKNEQKFVLLTTNRKKRSASLKKNICHRQERIERYCVLFLFCYNMSVDESGAKMMRKERK